MDDTLLFSALLRDELSRPLGILFSFLGLKLNKLNVVVTFSGPVSKF
jgi:hypothetical protein